uniref:Uncharacterized protein n=1 Tax=Moniliophthora roreri TaxID=221103 RepID=A0A0W0EVH8_MONRR
MAGEHNPPDPTSQQSFQQVPSVTNPPADMTTMPLPTLIQKKKKHHSHHVNVPQPQPLINSLLYQAHWLLSNVH